MDMKEEITQQLETIENMTKLLINFREEKKKLFANADIIDEFKANNYKQIIEWINKFSKSLVVETSVVIKKDTPYTRINFFVDKETGERTFNMECGPLDKRYTYDYHDLIHGMFEHYKRNEKKVVEGKYDYAINIMPYIADNHTPIRKAIVDKVEEVMYLTMEKEEEEFKDYIKSATKAVNFSI